MGKPYASELERLPGAYDWAMSVDIGPVVDLVGSLAAQSLLAVGSGGSFTAAAVAAYLHQRYAQKLARAVTPMEAVSLPTLQDVGVLIATGGGRNPDVLGCFERIAQREPQELAVFCAAENTPLAALVASFWYSRIFEFSPPWGKDGFIATNSLVATTVLLARAYEELYGDALPLATTHSGIWGETSSEDALEQVNQAAAAVSEVNSLLVLYGPSGFAAALDLESKCSETGIATVQLADFRNFAHGRHHGLSIRSSDTGVLAIITEEEREVASKTLSLLPGSIRVGSIQVRATGTRALVATLISVINWVGVRGRDRRLDPGRPTVAPFGRKLYHLNSLAARGTEAPAGRVLAIERKTRMSIARLRAAGALQRWQSAVNAAVQRYNATRFRAVVFDYDGTLCPPRRRYKGIQADMAAALDVLLRHGVTIGIATGRGKSVRQDLAGHVSREYWRHVWVGYYNGGQISTLEDDSIPDKTLPVHADLERFVAAVEADERLNSLVELDRSSCQITLFPKAFEKDDVWDALLDLCRDGKQPIVRSTHSFDVLAPGVSKLNVVNKVRDVLGSSDAQHVLRFGDLGRWPGNDYELLADEFGLSVDQVSLHPAQCWNFAPAGHRGTQATLDYLHAMTFHSDGAALELQRLGLEVVE